MRTDLLPCVAKLHVLEYSCKATKGLLSLLRIKYGLGSCAFAEKNHGIHDIVNDTDILVTVILI
jgi:hypothetical protein